MALLPLSNGNCYRLDIDVLISYCTGSQDDRTIQTDVTELYKDGLDGLQLVQKQCNETKVKNGTIKTSDSFKYDIIKIMIDVLTNTGIRQGDGGNLLKFNNIEQDISISETIAWNTLISLGILVEIKTNKN
jgi:hypothetical protein